MGIHWYLHPICDSSLIGAIDLLTAAVWWGFHYRSPSMIDPPFPLFTDHFRTINWVINIEFIYRVCWYLGIGVRFQSLKDVFLCRWPSLHYLGTPTGVDMARRPWYVPSSEVGDSWYSRRKAEVEKHQVGIYLSSCSIDLSQINLPNSDQDFFEWANLTKS